TSRREAIRSAGWSTPPRSPISRSFWRRTRHGPSAVSWSWRPAAPAAGCTTSHGRLAAAQASGLTRPGAAQEDARRAAGGLAVLQSHLPVDDGGGDSLGLLHESAGAAGQIGLHRRHRRTHATLVEHHEVRPVARAHEPAVVDLPGRRVVEGELAHRFLERERLALTHPVAQEM